MRHSKGGRVMVRLSMTLYCDVQWTMRRTEGGDSFLCISIDKNGTKNRWLFPVDLIIYAQGNEV